MSNSKVQGFKPVIGITASEQNGQNGLMCSVLKAYTQAIVLAGGIPLLIPQFVEVALSDELVKGLDGILFTGGEDVSPLLYHENPVPEVVNFSDQRDHHEIALVKSAQQMKKPILGICRGMQLINVALGGTLIQDIKTTINHNPKNTSSENLCHCITLEEDSILYRAAHTRKVSVNSTHHQAIARLTNELIPTAYSEDGILEACESKDSWYVHCVQFHPEVLLETSEVFKAIFLDFIKTCSD